MGFDEVYEKFAEDIKVTALSQRVPGLDYDDVVSEMSACLWIAWNKDKQPDMPFGKFWWSLWLNRKADLIRSSHRMKRPQNVIHVWSHELMDQNYLHELIPSCSGTRLQQNVWKMLAVGYTPTEVQTCLGISRRTYYGIIQRWRTPEIEDVLK